MVAPISFQIESNLVTKRVHAQIMREVNRGMLQRWADRYLPRHFEGGATQRYGYRIRGQKYLERKRRKVGHTIPLVLTGKLRDTIRGGVRIRATQYRGTLTARGYFPMREEMRGEIERIIDAERTELTEWGLKEYLRLARQRQRERQRRKG